jgi:hypothetical protein
MFVGETTRVYTNCDTVYIKLILAISMFAPHAKPAARPIVVEGE